MIPVYHSNDDNDDNHSDDTDLWLILPPAIAHDFYLGAGAQSQPHFSDHNTLSQNIGPRSQLMSGMCLVMQLTLSVSVRLEVRTLDRSQHGVESCHHTKSLDNNNLESCRLQPTEVLSIVLFSLAKVNSLVKLMEYFFLA